MLPVRRKRNNLLRHRGRSIFVILHCTESKESILFLCRQQTGAELLGFQQKVQVWCRLYCTGRQLGARSWDCCHCRAPLAASACHVPGMGGSRRAQGQWCWVTCGTEENDNWSESSSTWTTFAHQCPAVCALFKYRCSGVLKVLSITVKVMRGILSQIFLMCCKNLKLLRCPAEALH